MAEKSQKARRRNRPHGKPAIRKPLFVFPPRVTDFFTPPTFPENDEKTRQAKLLHVLLLSTILILLFGGAFVLTFVYVEKLYNSLTILALIIIMVSACLFMRKGRVQLASIMFVVGQWLVFTAFLLFAGGMTSIVAVFYLVGTVLAGLLMGFRGALIHAIISSLAGLGMVILEQSGYLLPRLFPGGSLAGWIDVTAALLVTAIVVNLSISTLNEALAETRSSLQERKRAEKALQKSEEKFRLLFETSRDFFYITDMEGNILEVNKAASTMSGYSEKELKGINIDVLYHDANERDRLAEMLRQQGFVENYEVEGRRKDGRILDVLVNSTVRTDKEGNVIGFQGSIKDISDRKKTEDALRESEERFARMSSVSYEGIGISEGGRIIDANPQLAKMLGYESQELIDKDLIDLIAPESRELLTTNMKAGLEGSQELRALRKDGTTFPVEIRARAIPYEGRKVNVSVMRDITERWQAEENIIRQMERLRALHVIDRVAVSSLNLKTVLELLLRELIAQSQVDAASVLLINPQNQKLEFAAKQGFRTDALQFTSLDIGAGLAGRAAKERKVVFIENLAKVRDNPALSRSIVEEGFVAYYGIPLVAKSQLHGVLEIFHRSPLPADPEWSNFLETLCGQAAIAIDNARLMEMTQANLKETEALYRINQGLVASIDPARLMHDVVELLKKNFGYFYVQIFVRDPESGDFIVRAGSEPIGEQLLSQGYRLATGEGIVGYTAETGTPFFTNDVDNVFAFKRIPLLPDTKSELAVPIRIADQFLGLLDIHQAPPAVLTQSDVRLVSAVADQLAVALQQAQLYSDLQNSLHQERATRSQLIHSEKLAVAGRLLASVAHELNNPLQTIQNALFLLKDEKGISTQGKQDLNIVLSESERMTTMLDRLRVTYKPVSREDFVPVDINAVIEEVHALVATHLRHAHIDFDFQPDPDLPKVSGVADQLRQVMLNLFMNARDAMQQGGRLSVSTLWLDETREVLINISDNGQGIDPAILPYIFEPFMTNKDEGTGLGLSISYDIVFHHGGRIQAENNPERGATFRVLLPAGN